MGAGIIEQLIKSEVCASEDVYVIEHNADRVEFAKRSLGVKVYPTGLELPPISFMATIIAVKPQSAAIVLQEVASLQERAGIVISIMAGLPLSILAHTLGHQRVVRAMPNLAVIVGQGVIGWTAGMGCSQADQILASELFNSLGFQFEIEENKLDQVTAIAGSGPGYFYAFAADLLQAAKTLGLEEDLTNTLVKKSLVGAVELYKVSKSEPLELADQVTSKNGTTAAAREVLADYHSTEMWQKALKAAYERAEEIGRSALGS